MDDTAGGLSLQKDVSSYSSFFKTQTSLLNDNSKVVEGENVSKRTGVEDYKNEETSDAAKFDIGTERPGDMNNNNDNDIQNTSQKDSKTEMDDKGDNHFDMSKVQNVADNLSKQTQFQNHIGHKKEENDYRTEVQEISTENGKVEKLHQENSPESLVDKQGIILYM